MNRQRSFEPRPARPAARRAVDLTGMPDELSRRLFDALRLEIHCDRNTQVATCRVTLIGESIHAVGRAVGDVVATPPTDSPPTGTSETSAEEGAAQSGRIGTVLRCAPNGIPTASEQDRLGRVLRLSATVAIPRRPRKANPTRRGEGVAEVQG